MDLTGIGSVAQLAGKVLDRVLPDQAAKDAAAFELFKAQQAGAFKEMDAQLARAQGQMDINKVEAASGSLFVSGWRPGAGWVGVFGLAYVGVIEPVARWVATVCFHYAGSFPVVDASTTMQVLLGLLGLSGMRMAEKIKGVASK